MDLKKKIESLKKKVGAPYQMFFDDGNYCGCFYPIYEIWSNLPRYPLPTQDHSVNYTYGMTKILKEFNKIDPKDAQMGDVLTLMYKNELHVALMISHNKLMHVFRGHKLQINKLSFFAHKEIKILRLKEKWQ